MDQFSKIKVLFTDDALLVINKPAGLSTLPDGYNPTLPHIKSVLEREVGPLWIVHRLDKDTSGVLLLARSADAHRSLNTQFEQHQVTKVYHAIVVGNPDWIEKTVNLPLRPNGDRQHRTVVDPDRGKPAVTHLKVLERFFNYCLVEAVPETGRTHQIRAHLYACGLVIVGDSLYGKQSLHNEEQASLQSQPVNHEMVHQGIRMGLHALSIIITHPATGETMKFVASYPRDFSSFLAQLRLQASDG